MNRLEIFTAIVPPCTIAAMGWVAYYLSGVYSRSVDRAEKRAP